MKGGRRARYTNNKDEFEGAERKTSRHANQYNQPNIDVLKSRAIKEGRRAKNTNNRDF